jgi:hypothetical protein
LPVPSVPSVPTSTSTQPASTPIPPHEAGVVSVCARKAEAESPGKLYMVVAHRPIDTVLEAPGFLYSTSELGLFAEGQEAHVFDSKRHAEAAFIHWRRLRLLVNDPCPLPSELPWVLRTPSSVIEDDYYSVVKTPAVSTGCAFDVYPGGRVLWQTLEGCMGTYHEHGYHAQDEEARGRKDTLVFETEAAAESALQVLRKARVACGPPWCASFVAHQHEHEHPAAGGRWWFEKADPTAETHSPAFVTCIFSKDAFFGWSATPRGLLFGRTCLSGWPSARLWTTLKGLSQTSSVTV